MDVKKLTDKEKGIIYDYLYTKLESFMVECEKKKGTMWADVGNIDMTVLVLEWVKSIMEDYHTAQVMTVPPKQSHDHPITHMEEHDDTIERFHDGWITEEECKRLRNSLPRSEKNEVPS